LDNTDVTLVEAPTDTDPVNGTTLLESVPVTFVTQVDVALETEAEDELLSTDVRDEDVIALVVLVEVLGVTFTELVAMATADIACDTFIVEIALLGTSCFFFVDFRFFSELFTSRFLDEFFTLAVFSLFIVRGGAIVGGG